MKAAITTLEIALEVMEANEPINRNEGNIKQADLEAKNSADIRQALAVLRAADAGPIWPIPKTEYGKLVSTKQWIPGWEIQNDGQGRFVQVPPA